MLNQEKNQRGGHSDLGETPGFEQMQRVRAGGLLPVHSPHSVSESVSLAPSACLCLPVFPGCALLGGVALRDETG